ncbi:MAG: TIM44-like domain-containing protein [Candidatus Dormibacteraeota bacterium]|nr:TIM44-like domain-containing protein [Candidatus Dormibacteraeota bacterium]
MPGDSTGLLPSMPNGLTFAAMRPLAIPLALVSLGIGFVLWRFMGDIPSVLSMGLEVLTDGLRHGGRSAPTAEQPMAYPVDAGIDAIRSADASFSATSFLAEVERIGSEVVTGWANRNLAECRVLMTDTCWDLQAAQLARSVGDGWRAFAQSVTPKAESIVAFRSEPGLYQINVRIRMLCPPGTAKVIRGRRISEWIEDWALVRPRSIASGTASGAWRVDAMNHVAVHLERAA